MFNPLSLMMILIISGIAISAHSEQIKVGEGTAARFNSLIKEQIKVEYNLKYDADEKEIYLYFEGGGLASVVCLEIKEDQKTVLLSELDKYQEWNKKAMSEGVTLEKQIGTFSALGNFDINKEWYNDIVAKDISATFFSQNKKLHQFVLEFPKFTSAQNEFITEQPDELYFSNPQAKLLAKQLTDESIQAALKRANKNKKVSDEFK